MQKMQLKKREKLRKDVKNMGEVLGWLKDKPLESCVKDLKEKERARAEERAEVAVREYKERARAERARAREEIRRGKGPWKGKKDDGKMRKLIKQMGSIVEQRERDRRTLAEAQMFPGEE